MRPAVVMPIPTVVVVPAVVTIPAMMAVMLDDDRPMVMPPMMIIARFSIRRGKSDNTKRNKRRCKNFHVQSPWVPDDILGLAYVRPD